jgi:CPA1 family monovalent cation:H+ antiporter
MVQESLLFVISLLFLVLLLMMLGQKLHVAYPVFLVIGGLLISFIPGVTHYSISPDLVFLIFLPPLLYEAAWYTSWRNFWKWRRPIGLLGFGLVIFTSLIVAFVTERLIPHFTLSIGFLLGGIISPPDAVAATSVLKFFKIPKSVKTILEGESLVNDASSLTVVRFAMAAVISGGFVIEKAATAFFMVTVMGILIGLLIAHIIYFVHRKLPTTPGIDTALDLLSPYIMYMAAEHFHYSGILAVVSGGLFLSFRSHEIMNHRARMQAASVWATITFVLNGLIFILIGLQLPLIVNGLKYYTLQEAIRYGFIVSGLIIVIRMVWIFPATYLPRWLSRRIRENEKRPLPRNVFLTGWAGMRGVVTLAAALAIPMSLADGSLFPERELVIFISFMVILVTLVLQGLTLPLVIRFLKIKPTDEGKPADVQAREVHLHLLRLSLNLLDRKYEQQVSRNALLKNLKKRVQHEIGLTTENIGNLQEGHREAGEIKDYWQVLLDIGEAQRNELFRLRKDNVYDDEVLRREESRVDLEEVKMG